jgi:hypothetical protein
MTISNGYSTLADVKTLLRITSTDATDDGVIERMVEDASRIIDGETWRRFWVNANDETRYYSAISRRRVYIDDMTALTSISLDQDGDRAYEITMASTDYDTYPQNAALKGEPFTWLEVAPLGNYAFGTRAKSIQVVGKFGFAATVPADIKMCCEEIVTETYKKRFGTNTEGAAVVTAAGVVITPRDIPDGAWKVILRYRRMV